MRLELDPTAQPALDLAPPCLALIDVQRRGDRVGIVVAVVVVAPDSGHAAAKGAGALIEGGCQSLTPAVLRCQDQRSAVTIEPGPLGCLARLVFGRQRIHEQIRRQRGVDLDLVEREYRHREIACANQLGDRLLLQRTNHQLRTLGDCPGIQGPDPGRVGRVVEAQLRALAFGVLEEADHDAVTDRRSDLGEHARLWQQDRNHRDALQLALKVLLVVREQLRQGRMLWKTLAPLGQQGGELIGFTAMLLDQQRQLHPAPGDTWR